MTKKNTEKELRRLTDIEYSNFERMCPANQNPVLSVLRAHLLTEYYMERIFHLMLPRGDMLSDANLSYAQKISLLEALAKIEDRTIHCLKNLNRVRNRCAHEYDKTITQADVELIGRPLGREHTEIRRKHVDDVTCYLREILFCICRNVTGEIYALEQGILSDGKDTENEKDE
ncbi:MAG TPA: hypothetical protein VMW24_23115 [Sedimentisphaerales bacterium]|nr:hypothetical protein [Sedimentisphaerales bacterium]